MEDEYFVGYHGNHLKIVKHSGRWREETTIQIIKIPKGADFNQCLASTLFLCKQVQQGTRQ